MVQNVYDENGDIVNTYYYHENARGDTVALTDTNGDAVIRMEYSSYGIVFKVDENNELAEFAEFNLVVYTFQGRRIDKETGLMYFRNRYYSTQRGRFISRDPFGYEDSYGLYSAFGENPYNYSDPFGLLKKYHVAGVDISNFRGARKVKIGSRSQVQISLLDLQKQLNDKYFDIFMKVMSKKTLAGGTFDKRLTVSVVSKYRREVGRGLTPSGLYYTPDTHPDAVKNKYPHAIIELYHKHQDPSWVDTSHPTEKFLTLFHELVHHWQYCNWGPYQLWDTADKSLANYQVSPEFLKCVISPCHCKENTSINVENTAELITMNIYLSNFFTQDLHVLKVADFIWRGIKIGSSEHRLVSAAAGVLMRTKDMKKFIARRKENTMKKH